MLLADLLSPDRVRHALAVADKPELLRAMAVLLAGSGNAAPESVLAALQEREKLGSTGLGSGLALPHGRLAAISRPVGAFAQLAADLDFDALDRRPVRLVFALVVPADAAGEHLQILAGLARLFHDKTLCQRLLGAKTPEELYNHLMTPSAPTSAP
jgi:nitrogen PTS system EIIA component